MSNPVTPPVINRVSVRFEGMTVAELARSSGHAYLFRWSPEYLRSGHRLLALPDEVKTIRNKGTSPSAPEAVTQGLEQHDFGGLPGFIWDALPDAWGTATMVQVFRSLGLRDNADALYRLAYVGNRGIGALSFAPTLEGDAPHRGAEKFDAARVELLARDILRGTAKVLSPELERMAREFGSVGGAHPKIFVGLREDSDEIIWGADTDSVVKDGFTPHILKLDMPPEAKSGTGVPPWLTRAEYAYHLMALAAGLKPEPMRLIETEGPGGTPRFHLAIRRFDRGPNGERRHFQSYAAATEQSHNGAHDCWYSDVVKDVLVATGIDGAREFFRRIVFNYAAHVTDDHLKNHGFLYDSEAKRWALSPPYDLVFSEKRHHAISLRGKADAASVGVDEWLGLLFGENGKHRCGLSLDEAVVIMEEVSNAVKRWPEFAAEAKLDAEFLPGFQARVPRGTAIAIATSAALLRKAKSRSGHAKKR